MRYADDFVMGFEYRSDAERLLADLRDRIRKIALVRLGRNKTLHIDYGAEHTPCGLEVARPDATEVHVADFYCGRLPKLRLCKTCVAYRQPRIADEMKILEAQYRAVARPQG